MTLIKFVLLIRKSSQQMNNIFHTWQHFVQYCSIFTWQRVSLIYHIVIWRTNAPGPINTASINTCDMSRHRIIDNSMPLDEDLVTVWSQAGPQNFSTIARLVRDLSFILMSILIWSYAKINWHFTLAHAQTTSTSCRCFDHFVATSHLHHAKQRR